MTTTNKYAYVHIYIHIQQSNRNKKKIKLQPQKTAVCSGEKHHARLEGLQDTVDYYCPKNKNIRVVQTIEQKYNNESEI